MGFEMLEKSGRKPSGWEYLYQEGQNDSIKISIDSNIYIEGRYSLKIESQANEQYSRVKYIIPGGFKGTILEIKGFLRSEDLSPGKAGIWVQQDNGLGESPDTINTEPLNRTNAWEEVSLKIPYNGYAKAIYFGGYLHGKGKLWLDNFSVSIDNKSINNANSSEIIPVANTDTSYNRSSGLTDFNINPRIIKNLEIAGQFWAFIKYYHPSIARGDVNWDSALFKLLPNILKCQDNKTLSDILEREVDELGLPDKQKEITSKYKTNIAQTSVTESFNSINELSNSLKRKIFELRLNKMPDEHYYVSYQQNVGNPIFENERSYGDYAYEDVGFRIISLYRYWAVINYFHPHRPKDWNKVLLDMLPLFLQSKTEDDYTICLLKLITKINDTHARLLDNDASMDRLFGRNTTNYNLSFIEGGLVVNGYKTQIEKTDPLQIGDIIVAIDGSSVKELIERFLPIAPGSNYRAKLKVILDNYLQFTKNEILNIKIFRNGNLMEFAVEAKDKSYFYGSNLYPQKSAYKLIRKNIGYIFVGTFEKEDMIAASKLFKRTRGIIIDFRCYPKTFLVNILGDYIRPIREQFAWISTTSNRCPGQFEFTRPVFNGSNTGKQYKGNVILLVDENTLSQSEYTVMSLQGSPKVKVLGSTTAGADGNISTILLPGNISCTFTGIGIYYPNKEATQGKGIKIDYFVEPKFRDIKLKRDGQLDSAVRLLSK